MSTKAVVAEELTRRYGYRIALRKVSLEFSELGIHGLFGSNGAGKTTLMRVISTLLRPHGGLISVMGFDPQEEPEEVKQRIGLVGDKALLDEPFSGLDKDTTEDFWEYLNEYRNSRTTIVTTHNLAFGAALCDEYVTLRKGVVVSQGPIAEFDQTL